MTTTIFGLFSDSSAVEDAINALRSDGFNPKDFSIVMKDQKEAKDVGENTGASVTSGALSGAATGAAIGGLAGLLAGTVLPGLGGFLIGGPIGAALGLTGAAATTVSGAATGIVAGGLLGALMGYGLSKDEAMEYQTRVNEGAILLVVPAMTDDVDRVKQIFADHHASDVRSVTANPQEMQEARTSHIHADRERNAEHVSHSHHHAQQYVSGMKGGASEKTDDTEESHASHHKGEKGGSSSQSSHTGFHHVNPIQVEKYLKGVDYPCSKNDLVQTAEKAGADSDVLETLKNMSGDTYNSPMDVSRAIGDSR